MEFKGLKLDLIGLSQVLLGLAAVITAWKSRKKVTQKNPKEGEGEP